MGFLINAIYSSYSASFIDGMEKYCKQNDCILIVFPISISKLKGIYDYQYDLVYDFIRKENIDVLVLATASIVCWEDSKDAIKQILQIPSLPTISVGLPFRNFPDIICNSDEALEELVTHLIEKHKRRKFLLMRSDSVTEESVHREKVFRETLKKHKIPFDENKLLSGNFISDTALKAISTYTKKRHLDYDAVVCLNDNMAVGCMLYFSMNNINVPEKVSVVGFDNDIEADDNRLNLSTVSQKIEEQSYVAVQKALDLFYGRNIETHTVIKASTVIRATCGCNQNRKSNYFVDVYRSFVSQKNMEQIHKIHNFMIETSKSLAFEDSFERLEKLFSIFDIPFAAVSLFKNPIYVEDGKKNYKGENTSLAILYNLEIGITNPNIEYNPEEYLIPPSISLCKKCSNVVFPLFAENYLYGFSIISFGLHERIFYQVVYELLAKEIVNALNVSRRKREKENLLKENLSLKEYTERFYNLSSTDEMTQLLNRRGFYEVAQQTIIEQVKNHKNGLVIYSDMDGLKKINDTYGHDAGDRAIKLEAEVLKNVFRQTDIIGRMGGDEFAVVSLNMKKKEFTRIKKNIERECAKLNESKNEKFTLSLSSGCVEFDIENYNLKDLLSLSDKLLYKAKRKKKKI